MNEVNTPEKGLILDIDKFDRICVSLQYRAVFKGAILGVSLMAVGWIGVSLWHLYDAPNRLKDLGKKICKEVEDEDTFE